MSWITLSLISPLFLTISNFVDKYILEKQTKGIFDYLFFCTLAAWLLTGILILFYGIPTFSWAAPLAIGTGILINYSYGFYAKALENGETSTVMLLLGLIPVYTIIFGYIFLDQTLSLNEILYSAIVVAGTLIISIEKFAFKGFLRPGTGWMMIGVIIWSSLFVFIDYILEFIPFEEYIIYDVFGIALAGPTYMILKKPRREILDGLRTATRKKFMWFILNDSTDLIGQITMKMAIASAPVVGLVTVLIQTQNFYLIAMGAGLTLLIPTIFKEDLSWTNLSRKILGSIIMLIGIYLLVDVTS